MEEVTRNDKIKMALKPQKLLHGSMSGIPKRKELELSEPSSGKYSDPLTRTLKQATKTKPCSMKDIQSRIDNYLSYFRQKVRITHLK